jgi:hypothetical protein
MKSLVTMTLAQAFKVATREPEHSVFFTPDEREEWNAARKVLVENGYCPNCARGGEKSQLAEWEPGNYWNHAGRECYNCEEFVVCGEQPEYGDASDEWRGDADPGL